MIPLLLIGCQEPFGTDRHDLVGFRVAALVADEGDGGVRPRAALIVDGRPWSDVAVDLRWFVLPDDGDVDAVTALSIADEPDGTGPVAMLDADAADRIALLAIAPDGTEARSTLSLGLQEPPQILTLTLAVPPLDLDATAAELARDARAALTASSADHVPADGFGRLTATTVSADEPPTVRWMATAGTFFELDPVTADWAAGELAVDDEDVIRGDALAPGAVTVVAFAVGGDGDNAFAATEVHVGPPGDGVRTPSGRWFPTAGPTAAGYVRGTLRADDASPVGLRLDDAVGLEPEALPDVDPFGTDALPCVGVSGPFDPDWLLDGRCLRAPLDGYVVVVEATP